MIHAVVILPIQCLPKRGKTDVPVLTSMHQYPLSHLACYVISITIFITLFADFSVSFPFFRTNHTVFYRKVRMQCRKLALMRQMQINMNQKDKDEERAERAYLSESQG